MPCFKGLAVSIHTPEGPLAEYSIQKQSKFSRITSYIPVPPAKIPEDSLTNKPEQSTFAISITLLTPGLNVPYSTPASTEDDLFPRPKIVGGLPGYGGERGKYGTVIGPYMPLTTSPNETIAAYIYFDGRQKEEVATLLRRGEETWVNSRWVGISESEGGGLAEREFLFREVGLERWLNGLDLDGKEAAAKVERRRQRMEKRRRRKDEQKVKLEGVMDMEEGVEKPPPYRAEDKGVLRYGADDRTPLEDLSNDEDLLSSDSESESEPPMPEATGQIKVALFRVLASGEIKRGEYSPQFDAHDDDEDSQAGRAAEARGVANGGGSGEADIDHTTSFAKPKSLDPRSISTQTVTGIDGPDKPYAVFTFLYRGKRQLQKMGILPPPETEEKPVAISSKRRSVQTDFAKLAPLKAGGTVGFSTFRDQTAQLPPFSYKKGSSKGKHRDSPMDSDEEDDDDKEVVGKPEDVEVKEDDKNLLSPEDAERQGELAEGVRKIKLKRQHSAEPLNAGSSTTRKTPASNTPIAASTPPHTSDVATTPPSIFDPISTITHNAPDEITVGSPLKKQRASLPGLDDETMRKRFGLGFAGGMGDIRGLSETDKPNDKKQEEEEL
ncbi:MAG: hypothetical protein M1812_004801 [Candelaria pacifica]|nr:MAG: hypothetical protein M1812_004801 [Candelaria pacifica]